MPPRSRGGEISRYMEGACLMQGGSVSRTLPQRTTSPKDHTGNWSHNPFQPGTTSVSARSPPSIPEPGWAVGRGMQSALRHVECRLLFLSRPHGAPRRGVFARYYGKHTIRKAHTTESTGPRVAPSRTGLLRDPGRCGNIQDVLPGCHSFLGDTRASVSPPTNTPMSSFSSSKVL